MERSMSVTSGGTAPKPLSTGGSNSASAGSAGMEMIFFTAHLSPSRYQVQIDDDKSFKLMTQLTNHTALSGRGPVAIRKPAGGLRRNRLFAGGWGWWNSRNSSGGRICC